MMLASLILGSAPSARRGHVLVMPPSARYFLQTENAAFGDVLLSGYPVMHSWIGRLGCRDAESLEQDRSESAADAS